MILSILRWATMILASALIVACAATPVAQVQLDTHSPWLDKEFDGNSSSVTIDTATLFHLAPAVLAALRSPELQDRSDEEKIKYLINTVLESKAQPFLYKTGHSTVAADTWAQRRGDCLALTILTYAIAKELQLPATMQEVPVPTSFDRHNGVDYLQGHVNLYIRSDTASPFAIYRGVGKGVVVDFEPSIGSNWKIGALTEEMMLARYYNNVGAEYFEAGDQKKAYAYFKAAIQADPLFSSAQTNLAGLYIKAGYLPQAEQLLLAAASRSDNPDVAIRSLYHLMVFENRPALANQYREQLIANQEQNPYYWIARGLENYKAHKFSHAIDDLKKAEALATGFQEIHVYLAMAYWKDNQADKAKEQFDALAAIDINDPNLPSLSRKFSAR